MKEVIESHLATSYQEILMTIIKYSGQTREQYVQGLIKLLEFIVVKIASYLLILQKLDSQITEVVTELTDLTARKVEKKKKILTQKQAELEMKRVALQDKLGPFLAIRNEQYKQDIALLKTSAATKDEAYYINYPEALNRSVKYFDTLFNFGAGGDQINILDFMLSISNECESHANVTKQKDVIITELKQLLEQRVNEWGQLLGSYLGQFNELLFKQYSEFPGGNRITLPNPDVGDDPSMYTDSAWNSAYFQAINRSIGEFKDVLMYDVNERAKAACDSHIRARIEAEEKTAQYIKAFKEASDMAEDFRAKLQQSEAINQQHLEKISTLTEQVNAPQSSSGEPDPKVAEQLARYESIIEQSHEQIQLYEAEIARLSSEAAKPPAESPGHSTVVSGLQSGISGLFSTRPPSGAEAPGTEGPGAEAPGSSADSVYSDAPDAPVESAMIVVMEEEGQEPTDPVSLRPGTSGAPAKPSFLKPGAQRQPSTSLSFSRPGTSGEQRDPSASAPLSFSRPGTSGEQRDPSASAPLSFSRPGASAKPSFLKPGTSGEQRKPSAKPLFSRPGTSEEQREPSASAPLSFSRPGTSGHQQNLYFQDQAPQENKENHQLQLPFHFQDQEHQQNLHF